MRRLHLRLLTVALFISVSVLVPESADSAEAPEKTKKCFKCEGTGIGKCSVPGCNDGQVDCSGPCVKMSGKWVKRPMPDHDPDTLWQLVKFIPRGSGYVSQGHVGEYFTVDSSGKVTPHACERCQRTGLVACSRCKGKPVCGVCAGKKVVPESWTAFDHPKLTNRPSRFRLKDGREIVGKKVKVLGETVTILTEEGNVQLKRSDIVDERSQRTER